MYIPGIVKHAIISNKGMMHYTNGAKPEQYNNFGILQINKKRYVVVLPKEPDSATSGIKKIYKGMLWKIDVEDNIPIITSQHFQYFSQSATNINTAVKAFNRYYRDSPYEPGELIEIFTINPK